MTTKNIDYNIKVSVIGDKELLKFQRSIDAMRKTSERSAASLKKLSGGFSGLLKFGAIAGALTIAAQKADQALRAVLTSLKEVDEAADKARAMDGTVNGLSALELAGNNAGVSIDQITRSMQGFSRVMAKASTDGGKQAKAFKALGLNLADLQKVDVDERLALIADAIQKTGANAGETASMLQKMGIKGRDMALLMLDGGDAIRKAREEVKALGGELSTSQVAAIQAAGDAMDKLGQVYSFVGKMLAANVAPGLTRLATAFTDSMRAGGTLRMIFDGLSTAINAFMTGLASFIEDLDKCTTAALAFATAIGVLAAALVALTLSNPLTAFAALAIASITLIIANWDFLKNWFDNKLPAMIQSALALWNNFVVGVLEILTPMIAKVASIMDAVVNAVIDGLNTAVAALKKAAIGIASMQLLTGNISGAQATMDWGNSTTDAIDTVNTTAKAVAGLTAKIDEYKGAAGDAALRSAMYTLTYEQNAAALAATAAAAEDAGKAVDDLNDPTTTGGGGGGGGGKVAKLSDDLKLLQDAAESMLTPAQKAAEELAKVQAALAKVGANNLAPEVLDRVKQKMKELALASSEVATQFKTSIADGIMSVFDAVIDKSKSFSESMSDALMDVAKSIEKFMLNQYVTKFLEMALSGVAGFTQSNPAFAPVASGTRSGFSTGGSYGYEANTQDSASTQASSTLVTDPGKTSAVQITIINETGVAADATATQSVSSNGQVNIEVLMERKVKEMFGKGTMDKTMKQSFGVSRRPG